jgi:hypothetical protein
VDIEQVGLTASDLAVTLAGTNATANVDLRPTAFGLAAVVPIQPGAITAKFTAAKAVDARLALTFANADGIILDAWDEQAALAPASDPTETTSPPPPESSSPPASSVPSAPSPPAASGTASTDPGETLAGTGGAAVLPLTAASLTLLLAGSALLSARLRARKGAIR